MCPFEEFLLVHASHRDSFKARAVPWPRRRRLQFKRVHVSAQQVNGLARVLNLVTVGSPPEVETGYQNNDLDAGNAWVIDEYADPRELGPPSCRPSGPRHDRGFEGWRRQRRSSRLDIRGVRLTLTLMRHFATPTYL